MKSIMNKILKFMQTLNKQIKEKMRDRNIMYEYNKEKEKMGDRNIMYEYNKEKDELTITTLKKPVNLYQYKGGTCFIREYGDIIIKDDGLHEIQIIQNASEFIPMRILNQLENRPEWIVSIEIESKGLTDELDKVSVEVIKPEEQISYFEKEYSH